MTARVCLINPSKRQHLQLCEPLNILLLGTILKKQGYEVKLLDENAHPKEDLWKEILSYKPDLVGVTATTTLVNDAYHVGNFCRQNKIRCVIGGSHASALPEEALKHFDLVVVGEGEKALLKIIREDIKSGIVTDEIIRKLDELPICDRTIIDMEYYSHVTRWRLWDFLPANTRVAQIITSRGCPFRCEYCYNSERKTPVRYMSPERIVDEIECILKDYHIDAIFFHDDELFFYKTRFIKLCNLLIERKLNIKWGCFARAESLEFETIKLAKESGCIFLCVGIESASPRMLEVINKNTTIKQMSRGIKIANELNIFVQGIFMLGYPGETIEDLKMTQNFIIKHKMHSIGLAIYTPFPGSSLWTKMKNENKIKYPLDYNQFTFDRVVIPVNDKMSASEIHKWRTKILIRGYLQPSRFKGLLTYGFKLHNIKRIIYLISNYFRVKS